MPEYDLGEIARRLAEGKTISEIGAELDGPPGPTPEEQAAADNRRQLQEARGALNADSASPGEMPDVDPIGRAVKLADESGHQRGTDGRMQAYVEGLSEAAAQGDPRVVHDGTIDDATRRRWHDEAHARQIANRNASGMRRR
jgi:hypothetical protein